uniref:Uncharacterized protein n=1 Tax=Octopus bimaculoides TaxID=37653 RepID=A0A0L8HHV1_OCTBM
MVMIPPACNCRFTRDRSALVMVTLYTLEQRKTVVLKDQQSLGNCSDQQITRCAICCRTGRGCYMLKDQLGLLCAEELIGLLYAEGPIGVAIC